MCDLTDALDAAQSRLSFHLKVLRDAGLVSDRREGRWMYYTLNVEALQEIAVEVLREAGLGWSGRQPRGLDGVEREPWDLVITVCDQAKEACPIFLGRPVVEHWGIPDPAAVEGDAATRRAAFVEALAQINRRVDDLLLRSGSLPAQTAR